MHSHRYLKLNGMGNVMRKLSTLFTTTLLALGLMLVTPSAMADPKADKYEGSNFDVFTCTLVQSGLFEPFGIYPFKNFGQCMKWINHS